MVDENQPILHYFPDPILGLTILCVLGSIALTMILVFIGIVFIWDARQRRLGIFGKNYDQM